MIKSNLNSAYSVKYKENWAFTKKVLAWPTSWDAAIYNCILYLNKW